MWRFKSLFLLALCLSVGACTHATWVRKGATDADLQRDQYACEKDARQSSYFGGRYYFDINFQAFQNRCMRSKGWSQEDEREVEVASDQAHTVQAQATFQRQACVERIRSEPEYVTIRTHLSDPQTGRYSLMQMASRDVPTQADAQVLMRYFNEAQECLRDFDQQMIPLMSIAQRRVFEQRYADSEMNAAELLRRQISYGEWAAKENKASDQTKAFPDGE